MANQQWNTDSNLGNVYEGSYFEKIIEYTPSNNDRKTLEPILLSSNLPDSITLENNYANNKVIISGTMPEILEDTTYYFTLRLTEVDRNNPSIITNITDRCFNIINKNKELSWNPNANYTIDYIRTDTLNKNLSSYLLNANGNETFKKYSGNIPDGFVLTDDGDLYGVVSDSVKDGNYNFTVKLFVDGLPAKNSEGEELEAKEFIINVITNVEQPIWISEEYIGNINKNELADNKLYILAETMSGDRIKYEDVTNEDEDVKGDNLSNIGLKLEKSGYISGKCTKAEQKDDFIFYAVAIASSTEIPTEPKKFRLSINKNSKEHEITWVDNNYDIGSFTNGEEISYSIPKASSADGSTIEYSFSGNYPYGLELTKDGILSGLINAKEGDYSFDIMAKSPYLYMVRTFNMKITKGLGENSVKLYLKINLEYKNEYNEIKKQLNNNTKYKQSISKYVVDVFPKIDVATLTCFDKEILSHKLKFGNPEIVRFGFTELTPYTYRDEDNNITSNYDAIYKSIDENTYQWNEIDCGNYPFDEKLEELKQTDEYADVELDTKLDFNNETYNTDVNGWKLIGVVDTYTKLLTYPTHSLKPNSYVKVLSDDRLDETENSIGYYKLTNDYDWEYAGSTIPSDVYSIIHTHPSYSYEVFNFENVRKILQEKVYVKKITGTYYYDEGSQQIIGKANTFTIKNLYSKGYGKTKKYYISDVDDLNEEHVEYDNHIVKLNNTILENTIFKQNDGTPDFIIINNEIYNVKEIENPWCYDFDNENNKLNIENTSTFEMVLPYITDDDVNNDGNNYIRFLDENIEPIPEWKRKQPVQWKSNTTYKTKTIIFNESTYYKVKQEFTSGNTFIYDTNLLEIINGEEIDKNLPKEYFPTLDLGYYERNTNNIKLKELNDAEKNGEFWYRKDFLFWDIIVEPVYNNDIESFGIPFTSLNETYEDKTDYATLTINPTPSNAIVTLIADGYRQEGNSITVKKGTDVTWKVENDDISREGIYKVTKQENINVSLQHHVILTINPIPSDATVIINGEERRSIDVLNGTIIKYIVEKEHYNSVINEIILEDNLDLSVELENTLYTYTINPTPADATVTINGEIRKSIDVLYGTEVEWTVSRTGYNSESGREIITENKKNYVNLIKNNYTLTINPIPSDATVTLTAQGYVQDGNSITVPYNTTVNYNVNYSGYKTETGNVIVNDNVIKDVSLRKICTLTITPTPNDAIVTINGEIRRSITAPQDTIINWSVSKEHYITQSDSILLERDDNIDVRLVEEPFRYTIIPTPADAIITLTAPGYTQVDNYIEVPYGTIVNWSVSKEHYITQFGSITITENTTNYIELIKLYKFIIYPTPADATVTLTAPGYTQVDNYIEVPYNTEVNWSVSKEHYITQNGNINVIQNTTTSVSLNPILYRCTINPTPADAIVTLTAQGYVQEGNSIAVPYNTEVNCVVSKIGYITDERIILVRNDMTQNINLEVGAYLDLSDYEYNNVNTNVTLNKYISNNTEVITPHIGE